MINETFRYFWRRTVPGGIWWENSTEAFAEIGSLVFVPMFAIGLSIGKLERMALLAPLFEAQKQVSWYMALPVSIVVYALASALGAAVLFLVLKAAGFGIMVWRFRSFMDLAERQWLLALTDLQRPTNLDKEEWLLDRIDETAHANYLQWLHSKSKRWC